jgi:uncharacterized paraquat-inducible protein A
MKKDYVKTTFGEWEKTHDPVGSTWVNCPECGIVLDDHGIPLIKIETCPRCDLKLSDYGNTNS